jgi:YVTN family beta-propeller protein
MYSNRSFLFALMLATDAATLSAQSFLRARLQELQAASVAGHHARALALADSLQRDLPDLPDVALTRAVVLTRAGRIPDAVAQVRRLLRWDARFAVRALNDSVLAQLRGEFADVQFDSLAERANSPVARGAVWAQLEERDLVAEGMAYDPATRSALIGSLNKYKVVAVDSAGRVSDRVPAARNGLRSVAGIHVDSLRDILWVTSNGRYDQPADTTRSALFGFQASTGRFRAMYPVPSDGAHFLNDLTTSSDGNVYITDSSAGLVWVLRPRAGTLQRFRTANPLLWPNGITMSNDGQVLFVADRDHIRAIRLTTNAMWKIAAPDSFSVAGIDGLAFHRGALIAHHPLAFWRTARYQLDPTYRRITRRDLIEANTADARTATTGEIGGAWYLYIGNGQLDRMNLNTLDSATMQPIRLYRAPLTPRSNGVVVVAMSALDSMALLDAHSLEHIATLPVGRNPHEIAAHPGGRRAYVANAGTNSVSVIDLTNRPRVSATWTLPDSISVHDVAVSADGRVVWAASGQQNVVLALDAQTGRVRQRYPLRLPGGWMLETGGPSGSIVIANLEGGAVTLLRPNGEQVSFTGTTGEIDAAATPDRTEIWSANVQTGALTIFSASGQIISKSVIGQRVSRLRFTPDRRTAVIVTIGDSTVHKFDLRSRRPTASLQLSGDPKVLALSGDGRRAYVTHPNRNLLTMIDLASMTVLRVINVPGIPDGVTVLEAGPEFTSTTPAARENR